MQQLDMLVRKRNRPGARRRKKLRFALRLAFSMILVLLAAALSAGIVRVVERPIAPWQGQADLPPGVLDDVSLVVEFPHDEKLAALEHVNLLVELPHEKKAVELELVSLVLEFPNDNQAVEQAADAAVLAPEALSSDVEPSAPPSPLLAMRDATETPVAFIRSIDSLNPFDASAAD